MWSNVQGRIAFTRVGGGEIGKKVDGGEGDVQEASTSDKRAPD